MTKEPNHLIALDISSGGRFTLLYNGPGKKVWGQIRHQAQPLKVISRQALIELFQTVPTGDRLPVVQDGVLSSY